MSTSILFLYNLFLISLYSGVMAISIYRFCNSKKRIYFWSTLLFGSFVIDDAVIFMSEMLRNFASYYNEIFMIVPTHKTLLYTLASLCYLVIFFDLLKKSVSVLEYGLVALTTIIMLFIPAMDNSAFKIWLYYFPSQLYLFYLGIRCLSIIKKDPHKRVDPLYKKYSILYFVSIILSIAIVIEDTIVIFNFDTYSKYYINMNSRSTTSDILYILFALFMIRYINADHDAVTVTNEIKAIPVLDSNSTVLSEESMKHTLVSDSFDSDSVHNNTVIQQEMDVNVYFHFCENYHLTTREREILKVLLEDKSNQEISGELFISLGTAKTHIHNIFNKTGVTKRQQLIRVYDEFREEHLSVSDC